MTAGAPFQRPGHCPTCGAWHEDPAAHSEALAEALRRLAEYSGCNPADLIRLTGMALSDGSPAGDEQEAATDAFIARWFPAERAAEQLAADSAAARLAAILPRRGAR